MVDTLINFLLHYKILILYILIISIVAIIVTVLDKIFAIKKMWRIPESTLFIVSIMGGSVAMYLTMLFIRHKTKHLQFMLGIPLIFVAEIALIYLGIKYNILNF